MDFLSFLRFESYFRLNKPSFKHVLDIIEPYLKKATRSTFVPNTIKLAATLRFLAQGSDQLSVGNDFNLGLSQPVVSKVLSETVDDMEREVCPQWINFDMTDAEKNEAKLYLFEKKNSISRCDWLCGRYPHKSFSPKKRRPASLHYPQGIF